jgi:hypothetical protein
MTFSGYRTLKVLAIMGVATPALFGENFLPPAEGPVAFRRDQVPLDADEMATLSRHLANLAEGLDGATPTSLRAAAQLLALATTLDPANHQARTLITRFQERGLKSSADEQQLQDSRERIWRMLDWLESPNAGAAGHALAACLGDVLPISDPKHPKAESLRTKGERGAWSSWIPDLAAYEVKPSPEEQPPAEVDTPTEEMTGDEAVRTVAIPLKKASISTPLWKRVAGPESTAWELTQGSLEMTVETIDEPDDEAGAFQIEIGPEENASSFASLRATILHLMLQLNPGEQLPIGGRLRIESKALDESSASRQRQSISAAAAVLACSAITGHPPEATIIGVVDRKGSFALPTGFWDQLQSLVAGGGKGGRLILPSAAADYLPALLALEKPQFFFDYEIILASDFSELLALSTNVSGGKLAKASTNFQEIRARSTPQTLGQYVANPIVRRRLVEVVTEAPNHYSAKLLAMLGAGNRPVFIPRKILELEIRRAIRPLDWIVARDSADFGDREVVRLVQSYERGRAALDLLARYAEKADRGVLDQALELVAKIRTLERVVRKKSFFQEVYSEYNLVLKGYVALHRELEDSLDEATMPSRQ